MCLETELAKPRSQRRPIDLSTASSSGWTTPSAGASFSGTSLPVEGVLELSGHVLDAGTDRKDGDAVIQPIDGTEGAPNAQSAATAAILKHSSYSSSSEQSDDAEMISIDSVERVINIKTCPMCHKPRLSAKTEVDIVTHLAICASQDWSTVNALVVGSFVTSSQAHRKWFTNVINKISNGTYQLGAVCQGFTPDQHMY